MHHPLTVLSKLTSFLPQMEAANSKLMAEMQVGVSDCLDASNIYC